MARKMPPLASRFAESVMDAVEIAEAGEIAGAAPRGTSVRDAWPYPRIELLYELAYVRIFTEWELFLEQTFLRYLCGFHSSLGAATMVSGLQYYKSIAAAESAVQGGRDFVLWHNPSHVAARSRRFFSSGLHETVVSANTMRLENFGRIRHRIVHSQTDAKNKFNAVAMALAGRRYPKARPGKFLRDKQVGVAPTKRWISHIGEELTNLAGMIA